MKIFPSILKLSLHGKKSWAKIIYLPLVSYPMVQHSCQWSRQQCNNSLAHHNNGGDMFTSVVYKERSCDVHVS